MPNFLEDKLRKQYRAKGKSGRELDNAVYGTLNGIGAMHGNQVTPKGKEMERKHRAKLHGLGSLKRTK
jgi:hypothetical protein